MGFLGWNQLNNYALKVVSGLGIFTLGMSPVWGQITPMGDTTVHSTPDSTHINVTGGISSADGTNLFHQFELFNIDTQETVNFVAPATVNNVLSRISGGQISTIDGGLAVSNNANLWLINPTGIVFGPHAQLNLQGDFTAATADAIGFDNGWFTDGTDYPTLVGAPRGFAFLSNPGNLINLGNLEVAPGQNLTLLGGSVVNTGNLNASDGAITIAAVANTSRVNLSQTGQLLTLEIEPWPEASIGITQLPTLLTGAGANHADTLAVATDGTMHLAQNVPELTLVAGHTSISGSVHSAGDYGGQIAILGEQISLETADINADGIYQGGNIYIGGSYQGSGPLPNATHTRVDPTTQISANALSHGNGGEIIVWADQVTDFGGNVQAQGGPLGGNGGFIEISGKSKLGFIGQFSVSAPHGEFGTVLFDPDNIEIVNGFGTASGDAELLLVPFGTVVADDGDSGWFTIHEETLELWNGDANIVLQANNDIIVRNLGGDNELAFQPGSGSISFIADADNNGAGEFLVEQAGDLIDTAGRDIMISGHDINIQSLNTHSVTTTGNISLSARNVIRVRETINGDDIRIQGNGIDFSGGDDSISGQTLTLQPWSQDQTIDVGSTTSSRALNLLESDLRALKDGFTNISLGRSDGTGSIIIYDVVADGGAAAFKDPVTILGTDILQGPNQVTTWAITGDNQGNLNSIFSNGLTFENVNSIVAGNNTGDTLQATAGDDTITLLRENAGNVNNINFDGIHHINGAGGDDSIIFANGVAELSGSIDGGIGNNTLDFTNYVTDVVIDLATDNASGTGGLSNIHQVIGGLGFNTIRGTDGDDVVILNGVDTGSLNELNFQGFERVLPGDGNDRFVLNEGVTRTRLDGGAGTDTLDYGPHTTGITIDLQNSTATNVTTLANIEDFRGGSGVDTLVGTGGADAIAITATNAGTLGNVSFIGLENIDTGAGNDTVSFGDGASITGVLIGGDGTDILNYNNYTTALTIDLQTQEATGINGGFTTIEAIVGGSGDDTFRLDDNNPAQFIKGGAGNNTFLGSNTDSIWNLTGINAGSGPGVINFDNIQNLRAGNQSDQVNFLANDAVFTGELDGAEGLLTLGGVSPNIGTALRGTGELVLQSTSPTSNIQLGGANSTSALHLSTTELSNIGPDFTGITIGYSDGTGEITFGDNVIFSAPVTIQSPHGNGSIKSQGFDLAAPTITLLTAEDIVANNLRAPNGVHLESSDGVITTQDIEGAEINISTGKNIVAGNLIADNDVTILSDTSFVRAGVVEASEISILAAQDIGTGNLRATNGVNLDSDNGVISTQDITASEINLSTAQNIVTGDLSATIGVTLQSDNNFIRTDAVEASEISILAAQDIGTGNLRATNGVNLDSDNGVISIQDITASEINLSTAQNIVTGDLSATIGVTLQSDNNFIRTGAVEASEISILAARDIVTDNLRATNGVNLENSEGVISTQNIEASDVNISTTQDVVTGSINATNGVILNSSDGSINTQGTNIEASLISLFAGQNIFAASLTAASGVSLKSDASIYATNISTRNANNGGTVDLNAGLNITTQQINTTGLNGIGGDVTLRSVEDIEVASIRAEGDMAGGNVDITTDEFFRVVDSFTALDGTAASISTAAVNGTGGAITLRHAGNSITPFHVGDSSLLGSHAALNSGEFRIDSENLFFNSYTLGNIAILTQDVTMPTVVAPSVIAPASIGIPAPNRTISTPDFDSPLIGNSTFALDDLADSLEPDTSNKALFERLERSYSEQFKSHLNLYERVSVSSIGLEAAQQTLDNVEALTGVKPGVLYVYFLPAANKDVAMPDSTGTNPDDELGVLLLTHNGQTIRKKIDGVTRSDVMAVATDFSTQVTNAISSPSQYLPPAQQLYEWFITPIENALQQQSIQSLALAMDTGLRTLPVAALHDGNEFLVERYSLGVIPSFSLTDFNPENFLYTQLEQTQLLAMGASQFPSQQLLPAVPEELTIVTQAFHDSEIFLNEDFTLDNLQNQVARHEFGIVHLASHGVFEPGEPSQSYIQLWDQPLQLDQVQILGLQEANIALMVLSACNTALGDREAEYGFAGLAVNAGVQTSVASLWPISDEGTLGLMTYFYEHLQQQPVRAIALREAQLAMLRGDLQFTDGTLYGLGETPLAHFPELEYHGRWNFEHPFYWSTYTLVGSPW